MAAHIRFMPDDKRVDVRPGTSVLDAARRARVSIRTRCSGKAACLMCKVKVTEGGGLSPLTRNEELKLAGMEEQGYRLACQAKVTGSVTVEVPEDPLKSAVRRQLEQQGKEEW